MRHVIEVDGRSGLIQILDAVDAQLGELLLRLTLMLAHSVDAVLLVWFVKLGRNYLTKIEGSFGVSCDHLFKLFHLVLDGHFDRMEDVRFKKGIFWGLRRTCQTLLCDGFDLVWCSVFRYLVGLVDSCGQQVLSRFIAEHDFVFACCQNEKALVHHIK